MPQITAKDGEVWTSTLKPEKKRLYLGSHKKSYYDEKQDALIIDGLLYVPSLKELPEKPDTREGLSPVCLCQGKLFFFDRQWKQIKT